MAKSSTWQDDYWLLLMEIYLQKPVGMKPLYNRQMVELGMELHIAPEVLFNKMCQIANLETPRVERFWELYGNNPKKLKRAVNLLREMWGFNNALEFYDGVETNESFEKDFKPIADGTTLTPVALTLILDLYFRLTPLTMVPETEEIQELAKMLKITPEEIVDTMDVFKVIDPYLGRDDIMIHPMLEHCKAVWNRYASENPTKLAALAAQLREYYKGGK